MHLMRSPIDVRKRPLLKALDVPPEFLDNPTSPCRLAGKFCRPQQLPKVPVLEVSGGIAPLKVQSGWVQSLLPTRFSIILQFDEFPILVHLNFEDLATRARLSYFCLVNYTRFTV
jgi:hypothetical protein